MKSFLVALTLIMSYIGVRSFLDKKELVDDNIILKNEIYRLKYELKDANVKLGDIHEEVSVWRIDYYECENILYESLDWYLECKPQCENNRFWEKVYNKVR